MSGVHSDGPVGADPPEPPAEMGTFTFGGGGGGAGDAEGASGSGALLESRRKAFKKTVTTEDARAKRSKNMLQLRRDARSARLTRRRLNTGADAWGGGGEESEVGGGGELPPIVDSDPDRLVVSAEERRRLLPDMRELLHGDDKEGSLKALRWFRVWAASEEKPPVEPVMDCDVIPKAVQWLGEHDNTEGLIEAAWIITNTTSISKEITQVAANCGAIDSLLALVRHPHEEVRLQVMWALGNLAGDSWQMRNGVLDAGLLDAVIYVLDETHPTVKMLEICAWCLANLCRGKPQPDYAKVRPALSQLNVLIYSDEPDIVVEAAWAIAYIAAFPEGIAINDVLEAGIAQKLVELLHRPEPELVYPALKTIGCICCGVEMQTQIMISAGVLPALPGLLQAVRDEVRSQALWVLSNITAGTPKQIEGVQLAGLFPIVVESIEGSAHSVVREACWVLVNATRGGEKVVTHLVNEGALALMVKALGMTDGALVLAGCDALKNIFIVGQQMAERMHSRVNQMVILADEAGATRALHEAMDTFTTPLLQARAAALLDDFLEVEDARDDEEAAVGDDGERFTFGTGGAAPARIGFS